MNKIKRHMVADEMVEDIHSQIRCGELQEGDRILSLNQLVERYRISKSSVTKAIAQLVDEGVLESIHGRGNFVRNVNAFEGRVKLAVRVGVPRKGIHHLGLSYPTSPASLALLSEIKDYALKRGSLLTVFDVSENRQDPNQERLFIENLVATGVSGIAVFATPIEPVNTGLFTRLRSQGIKVAIVSPYKYDIADQVGFFVDYRQLGYQAVTCLTDQGCENICFVRLRNRPVYIKWLEEGIMSACRDSGISADPEVLLASGVEHNEKLSLEAFLDRNSHLEAEIRKLPLNSGLICRALCEAIAVDYWGRSKAAANRGDIRIFSCNNESRYDIPVCCARTETHDSDLLKDVVDYLEDDTIEADFIFQRFYRPSIVL